MIPTSGGYILTKVPMMRTGLSAHSAALERPVSPATIDALNVVQATPWRINAAVLGVMKAAEKAGWSIAGLPDHDIPEMPERVEDERWAAMTDEDKKAHTMLRRRVHSLRASARGRRQAFLDRIMVAGEMQDDPAIWFPHTLDFRGRMYPVPVTGPHPQGDDVAKGLLQFAHGKPLGLTGFWWLAIRAANSWGHDKLPLEERVAWVLENREAFVEASMAPHSTRLWWSQAEEPWQFLATVFEVGRCLEKFPDLNGSAGFVSYLPVPLDGSCNGLQHLSAMGRDPVGAVACNLAPGPRQDIYQEVARHVEAKVERDAASGDEIAAFWRGHVSRSTVKRAVMTTPYGVTEGGIRLQLMEDGNVPPEVPDHLRSKAAACLKDALVYALSQTIEAGKEIMAWLQKVAAALAVAGVPFDWTTPTGMKCRQAYQELTRRRVDTLSGRLVLYEEVQGGAMNVRKQVSGSAPNVVHSFDAAHLALTSLRMAEEVPGVSLAMIHDSFGTHAADTGTLAWVLRRVFADIYRTDWLQAIHEEVKGYAPHVDIPDPPALGTFDVRQVEDAEFFFA